MPSGSLLATSPYHTRPSYIHGAGFLYCGFRVSASFIPTVAKKQFSESAYSLSSTARDSSSRFIFHYLFIYLFYFIFLAFKLFYNNFIFNNTARSSRFSGPIGFRALGLVALDSTEPIPIDGGGFNFIKFRLKISRFGHPNVRCYLVSYFFCHQPTWRPL